MIAFGRLWAVEDTQTDGGGEGPEEKNVRAGDGATGRHTCALRYTGCERPCCCCLHTNRVPVPSSSASGEHTSMS
jgi:hypothetical protein